MPAPADRDALPDGLLDDLLDDLDPEQRAAVTADAAPLAILAPAGSGKTRVLTRRIAWLARSRRIAAEHVLAVTFTRKAAGELVHRLRVLEVEGVTAGTFHALALAQLRRFCAERGRDLPAVLDRKGRVLGPLLGRDPSGGGAGRGAGRRLAVSEVASEIEWARARLVPPDAYPEAAERADRQLPRPAEEIASIYRRYEQEKRRRGLVDFDDLLWWCAQRIEEDADFAASQRFRFRHLFVDEFQDVSPLQVRLVRAWLGDRRDLCVVGDDAQAIYGFAGADAQPLRRFPTVFPGASVVHLRTNYRSTPQVVRASAAVLGRSAGVERDPPRSVRPDGPVPRVAEHPDEAAEATAVARALRDARTRGVHWRDMAVLFRTNAQSAAFEHALAGAGIPHRITGGTRFVDRPEVRALLDELRAGEQRRPGRDFTEHLADLELAAVEATTAEREQHATTLAALGRDYVRAEGTTGTLEGFLAWLTAALRDGDPAIDGSGPDRGGRATGDVVELLTFHRAKGLEWPVVFVTGLERGLVPIARAQRAATVAEERRLLHVALSRAVDELHLSWAARRSFGARDARRTPSPYLELVVSANQPGPADRVADPKAGLRRARGALARGGAGPPADPDLLAALKEWRRHQARAVDVPAFVVFHDATLDAIARARPTSTAELLGIHGVGPAKVERYGSALLELVATAHPDLGRSGG